MQPLKFKTKIKVFTGFVGMHYLEISKAQVKKLGGKFLKRLICTVNGKIKYQCALQGLGNGSGWIALNKTRMKELGVEKGHTVSVLLIEDKSKYGLPMPAELNELLKQDQEGKRRFKLLSPGKQRNILHYVGMQKDSDRRLDRAVTVIENLKQLDEGRETVTALFGMKPKINRLS